MGDRSVVKGIVIQDPILRIEFLEGGFIASNVVPDLCHLKNSRKPSQDGASDKAKNVLVSLRSAVQEEYGDASPGKRGQEYDQGGPCTIDNGTEFLI